MLTPARSVAQLQIREGGLSVLLQAPSLLITLINMFLEFTRLPSDYVVEDRADPDENEYSVFGPSPEMATLQAIIQKGLVIVAVASVPVMLFVKPLYLRFQHKRKAVVSATASQSLYCSLPLCLHRLRRRPTRPRSQSRQAQRQRWCMAGPRMAKWGANRMVMVTKKSFSLGRCSSTRPFTPLSTVWEPSLTLPRTSGSGLSL